MCHAVVFPNSPNQVNQSLPMHNAKYPDAKMDLISNIDREAIRAYKTAFGYVQFA
jgi:hypothetical protein